MIQRAIVTINQNHDVARCLETVPRKRPDGLTEQVCSRERVYHLKKGMTIRAASWTKAILEDTFIPLPLGVLDKEPLDGNTPLSHITYTDRDIDIPGDPAGSSGKGWILALALALGLLGLAAWTLSKRA